MKKSMIISCMVIGMSLISTTGFAKVVMLPPTVKKTNTEVIIIKHEAPKPHVVKPHHHDYNRHNECRICHLNKKQIKQMEKEMRKHDKHHETWRNTAQRPVRR